MSRKRLILIVILLLGTGVIVWFGLQARNRSAGNKEQGEYYKDPKTGEVLFQDKNQEKETVDTSLSVIGVTQLSEKLPSDQVLYVTNRLEEYIKQKYPGQNIHKISILNQKVDDEAGGFGFTIETDPDVHRHRVSLKLSGFEDIAVYVDGQGPLTPPTDVDYGD
jgi:hypothetical protein